MACKNPKFEVYARPTSGNSKTGNIPTVSVGTSLDQAVASCRKSKCPMLPKRFGGKNGQIGKKKKLKPCYAWTGTVSMAAISTYKKIARVREEMGAFPVAYTVKDAVRRAVKSAQCVRVTALGDVSALPAQQWYDEIEKPIVDAEMHIYGFTAGWRFAHHLKGKVMASNFSWRTADNAVAKGWRSTCVVSKDVVGEDWSNTKFTSPAGNKAVVCPHQVLHGRAKFEGRDLKRKEKITCNTCRKCVAAEPGPIIVFVEH